MKTTMTKHGGRIAVALALASALAGGLVSAQDRRPPQAALDACASRSRDAACSFSGPNGEAVSGTCVAPEGLPLACMPAHPPRHGRHHGPPPEAIQACADTAEGDACAVDTPRGTREGVCDRLPAHDGGEGVLACRPSDMEPPPDRRGRR